MTGAVVRGAFVFCSQVSFFSGFNLAGARLSPKLFMAALALTMTTAPLAAKAETSRLGGVYDVSVSGFKVGRGTLSLVVQGNAYSAKMGMEPAGVGSLFSTGKGGAEASGWVKGSKVYPARYTMASRAANRDFYVDLAQNGGNVRSMEVTPKFKPNKERIVITGKHRRNIVDPLSAILMPVKRASDRLTAKACDRKIPIFDGWTRFDVKLKFKELRQVSGRGYDGPVVVCSARWVPVAGHRPSKESVKYLRDNRDIEAWLAPVGNSSVMVPYKIAMSTKNGRLVVEASRLNLSDDQTDQAAVK